MKNASFHDILLEKMQSVPETSTAPLKASVSYEASPDFTIFDLPTRFFRPPPPKKKISPSVQTVTSAVPPSVTKPPEKIFLKKNLNEESLAKWNLFEKTFGVNLGEQTTKSIIMSGFRRFMKSHHPDLNRNNVALHNFATLVKIKDELIKVLKELL